MEVHWVEKLCNFALISCAVQQQKACYIQLTAAKYVMNGASTEANKKQPKKMENLFL